VARASRLDMPGFHHLINRGVAKQNVFNEPKEFEYFLNLLCRLCQKYEASVHSYCLMNNHYHLLLETTKDNLSLIMRSLNAQYASFFNKKEKRVGHLWQGRFKSMYISDEVYLHTVIRYIESNPVKAGMTECIGDYPYASSASFVEKKLTLSCLNDSMVFRNYPKLDDRIGFFEQTYDQDELDYIKKSSTLLAAPLRKTETSMEQLAKIFEDIKNKKMRNEKIKEAVKQGFSQYKVATYLGLTQASISLICKSYYDA
jgi:putative transposase